jgi:hypothetical protein
VVASEGVNERGGKDAGQDHLVFKESGVPGPGAPDCFPIHCGLQPQLICLRLVLEIRVLNEFGSLAPPFGLQRLACLHLGKGWLKV